jgi:uncharacterized protein (DUF697 family)
VFDQSSEAAAMTDSKEGATVTATIEELDELASKMVERYSLWSGAAALIPLPMVDVAAVGGLQYQMLRRLSKLYGVPFSDNRGKSIIASFAGSLIPASTATTTTMGVASVLKSFPGIGTTIALITMPAFSAGATYVIGQVFARHFASGGTLLDFNAPDYHQFIKAQKEKFCSRSGSAPPSALPAKRRASSKAAQAESK